MSRLKTDDPEKALKELKSDLWRLQNDTKSAMARWPSYYSLRNFARRIGIKD